VADSVRIDLPVSRETLAVLNAGDEVRLFGEVYTARDATHAHLLTALDLDGELPFGLEGATLFYAGPTPLAHGRPVHGVAVGRNIIDPDGDNVAASQLAVDRQIEQRQIANAPLQLQPGAVRSVKAGDAGWKAFEVYSPVRLDHLALAGLILAMTLLSPVFLTTGNIGNIPGTPDRATHHSGPAR